jgi:hypothetical protein
MRHTFQLPEDARLKGVLNTTDRSAESALKNFRYIVAAVNDDALKVWADLWNQFREGVTPGGIMLPEMSQGLAPSCGWAEFLEKFWLLKHYLDYIHRFCDASTSA